MASQPDPIPPEGTPPPLTEGFLTAKEAAKRMGLSVETMRAMCSDDVLPGAVRDRDNGPWRVPADDIETWLAQQNKTPQPKAAPTSAALPPTRFWRVIVMIGAIVGILGLVSVIANSLNVADRWRVAHATPTPLPFERAKAVRRSS
jgi:excisionase family DNA binding protein